MKLPGFLWKNEKGIFVLFVLITALPVLLNAYFPTVDGPSHLYNANLLKHYWFHSDEFLLGFFDLNKHLTSNLLDHVWFAFFGLFLPSFLVEKSILLFYLFALPFSFRYLLKSSAGDNHSARISSYLIFPFVYSFTFRIGFFNFCAGIPLLFWTLGYWAPSRDRLNPRRVAALTLLATLVYISHLFNFLLLGIIVFVNELQYIIHLRTVKNSIRQLRALVVVFIPGLILFILFYLSNRSFEHAPPSYLEKGKLAQMLLQADPVITLDYGKEHRFAQIIGLVMCLLIALVLYDHFKERNRERQPFRPKWIFSVIIVLALYFLLPDWLDSGGFISIRWALFFFLLLIILAGTKGLSPALLIVPVIVLMINHLFFMKYHYDETAYLSEQVKALAGAEKQMEEHTVLLPLNYSHNWMHINYASYMTTEKNIINLDNYEPGKPHFPLLWKKGEHIRDLMPGYENRNPPCINIENYERKTHRRIGYLSRFCFDGNISDSCALHAEQEIKSKFELIYESADKQLQLYKRKPNT
jgi:hypothetical protein